MRWRRVMQSSGQRGKDRELSKQCVPQSSVYQMCDRGGHNREQLKNSEGHNMKNSINCIFTVTYLNKLSMYISYILVLFNCFV